MINFSGMLNNLIGPCFQTSGYFKFIDGWHLSFASWAEGEPTRNQPCVYMDVDGKWKTALCNRTMNSVCIQSTGTIISRQCKKKKNSPSVIHISVRLCRFILHIFVQHLSQTDVSLLT